MIFDILRVAVDMITLGVVVLALIIARKRLLAAEHATLANAYMGLVAFLQASHVRDARAKIIRDVEPGSHAKWRDDEAMCEAAQLVASTYDIAAIAMEANLVNEAVFVRPWSASIVRCYDRLEDYIQARRHSTVAAVGAPGAEYFSHFQRLAERIRQQAAHSIDGPSS